MDSISEFSWEFKELPFMWSELSSFNNGDDIPNTLPFSLFIDKTNGVLSQKINKIVEETLSKAYKKGSVFAGVMEENNQNSRYAQDFLSFFIDNIKHKDISQLKILEIGSGTGYLLSLIKKLGAEVIGIEPGVHCLKAFENYGVEIINDFFPSKKITGKYDVIIMTGVLEHIPNPSKFLESLQPYLKTDGLLFISVPDVEPQLKVGDISILFHEHCSYFTDVSLNNTCNLAKYEVLQRSKSNYGGLLFFMAQINSNVQVCTADIVNEYSFTIEYKQKAIKNIQKLEIFLNEINTKQLILGVYVPSRFINFLSLISIDTTNIRFFDDNESIYEKYYPGFDIKIENKVDLITEPTDIVLIFSHSFGKIIRNNIINDLPHQTKIIVWEELFSNKELEEL